MAREIPLVTLDASNLASEHLCCAIADKKSERGVACKKQWLEARIREGLRFTKLDVRGKVFIEYVPAEQAWRPIDAPGYMFIHCLWVSGRYKGQGHSRRLLDGCLKDARKMNGIAVVSSTKLMPFLTDKRFFLAHGFEVCDTAPPYFELLVRRNKKNAPSPRFQPAAKENTHPNKSGLTFLYSYQCPFTDFWVDELIEVARERSIPWKKVRIRTTREAQRAPSPYATFSVYYNGDFLTHKIPATTEFGRLLDQYQRGRAPKS